MSEPTVAMMRRRLDRLMRSRIVLVVTCLTLTAAWPVTARGDDPFVPGCTLPLAAIA